MLIHPMLDKLQTLRFFGMLSALEEQMKMAKEEKIRSDERRKILTELQNLVEKTKKNKK